MEKAMSTLLRTKTIHMPAVIKHKGPITAEKSSIKAKNDAWILIDIQPNLTRLLSIKWIVLTYFSDKDRFRLSMSRIFVWIE